MSQNHLAITSIQIQEWGVLYSEKEALNVGTIFHDLNKPFFAAEGVINTTNPLASNPENPLDNGEKLLEKITETQFFLDDLTLYLDTHEKDLTALKLYHEKAKECLKLKEQFAQEFYPLTTACIPCVSDYSNESFCWQKGPMPWEGACV